VVEMDFAFNWWVSFAIKIRVCFFFCATGIFVLNLCKEKEKEKENE
jgi:hypothetical protein